MVRKYIKKTSNAEFSDDQMTKAVTLVMGGMALRNAAEECGVYYVTLFRYVKKFKDKVMKGTSDSIKYTPNYQVRQVFTSKQEQVLVKYVVNCSKMFYGLPTADVRRLAYEMAVNNNVKCPKNWTENKSAGIDWLYGFLKRYPTISQRTPEGCSLSRATSFNRSNVNYFFDRLLEAYNKHPDFADESRVFNLDETSTTTLQRPAKVVAEKGKKVCKITSAEKGTNVTTCCIVSASENTLPPVMVFPRVHFKQHMTDQASPGTLGLATPSGWMTSELFLEVMKHVIKFSQSSKEKPTLLLYDNVESHLSIGVIDLAKENGVTILTFPPHTTNKLQPLDVGLYKPFKTFYIAAIDSLLLQHPGTPITIYQIASCVNSAHQRAMTLSNIVSAWKKCGIFPYDRHIFNDDDFMSSSVTDRPQEEGGHPENTTSEIEELDEGESIVSDKNANHIVNPEEFRGYPKAGSRKTTRKGRGKGKCRIITNTPEKNELLALKKNPTAKRHYSKSQKTNQGLSTQIVESYSDSTDGSYSVIDTDDDMDIDEIFFASESNFKNLERTPQVADYVLVCYSSETTKKFYVGQIKKPKDEDDDYEIKFLWHRGKGQFTEPLVEDIASVNEPDIKQILEDPKLFGARKRQQGFLKFGIDFSNLNMG